MEDNYTELPSRYASEFVVAKLRDHVGSAYRVAEQLSWIQPGVETEYLSLDRDLDLHPEDEQLQAETGAKIGFHPPQRIRVAPILSVHFQGESETVDEALAEVRKVAESVGIEIEDVYTDEVTETLGVRFEPFVIEVDE